MKKAARVRMTPQRKAVLAVLHATPPPWHAPTILAEARRLLPGVDRATVYRTLALVKRWHGTPPGVQGRLVCTLCGRCEALTSVMISGLLQAVTEGTGFDIESIQLDAAGRCLRCRPGARA